jgi:dihydrofolate reductase
MGKIRVVESITVDGVMQGPGRPDEDTRGGFAHGGWAAAYADHVAGQFMGECMASSRAMLFGHRTYQDVLGYWTTTADPNPFTDVLVNAPKYVASRSSSTTLAHPHSTLLAGEAATTVSGLGDQVDGDITVIGSGALVRALHAAGLVDEYVLQVHPVVLGSGTQLFGPDQRTDLTLQRSVTTTTGVVIAQYSVTPAATAP